MNEFELGLRASEKEMNEFGFGQNLRALFGACFSQFAAYLS